MNEHLNDYIQAYAVLRIDGPVDSDARVTEFEINGEIQPTAGPSNVVVKQIVMSAQEARNEVMRLNRTNAGKSCAYYWQSTHLFINGGSHGNKNREANEYRI